MIYYSIVICVQKYICNDISAHDENRSAALRANFKLKYCLCIKNKTCTHGISALITTTLKTKIAFKTIGFNVHVVHARH